MTRMNHRLREIVIGVVLTALFLAGRGYVFGTRDHAIHLPYILRAADPGFLPGDPMLEVAAHHPTFFFPILAALTGLASLETLYFAAYAISVLALMIGLRALARHLWPGRAGEWAAAVAVAGAFVHRYVPGSIENLDAMFLPRVASLGPLLYALSLGARRRYHAAFALTGLLFLVHATTASHTAFVLWVGCALGGRENMRACLLGPVLFLALAGPLLVWMAVQGGPGIPTPSPEAWIQSLKLHWPFHHFPRLWVLADKVGPAVIAVGLGLVVSRWRGAGRVLAGYLGGTLVLIGGGWLANRFLYWPTTIHLHLIEAGRILDCLALVALGRWSFHAFHAAWPVRIGASLVVAAYLIRTPLHAWVDFRFVPDLYLLGAALAGTILMRPGRIAGDRRSGVPPPGRPDRGRIRPPAMRTGYLVATITAASLMVLSGRVPMWHTTGNGLRGYPMMQWARDHLPADAVVFIPPYMDEVVTAFRYFARRRALGAWKDGGEGTFDMDFQLAWERQVRDITGTGDRIRVPRGSVFWLRYVEWLDGARARYHRRPARHFRQVARTYGATHLVREAWSPRLALPVVYEDDDYVVYEISWPHDGG